MLRKSPEVTEYTATIFFINKSAKEYHNKTINQYCIGWLCLWTTLSIILFYLKQFYNYLKFSKFDQREMVWGRAKMHCLWAEDVCNLCVRQTRFLILLAFVCTSLYMCHHCFWAFKKYTWKLYIIDVLMWCLFLTNISSIHLCPYQNAMVYYNAGFGPSSLYHSWLNRDNLWHRS